MNSLYNELLSVNPGIMINEKILNSGTRQRVPLLLLLFNILLQVKSQSNYATERNQRYKIQKGENECIPIAVGIIIYLENPKL